LSKEHLDKMVPANCKTHRDCGANLGKGRPVRGEVHLSCTRSHDNRTAFSGSTVPRGRPVNDHRVVVSTRRSDRVVAIRVRYSVLRRLYFHTVTRAVI